MERTDTRRNATTDAPTPPRVLRPAQAARYVGLSRAHVYRLEARGDFPRRVELGAGATAYVVAELDGWIAAKVADRDTSGGDQNAHERTERMRAVRRRRGTRNGDDGGPRAA